jgi:hypothetical protein
MVAVARRVASTMASLPAPTGGWNARDAIANMKESDAVILDNWWPTTSDIQGRKGWSSHVTGIVDDVETLMVYASTSEKMFAAADEFIYPVTSAGAVGSADVSGLTNSRWQWINVATTGAQYLYAVNGADKPLLYDGSSWTAIDGVSTPAITGVTTTGLIDIALHKNRVWFVQKDTLTAWYLPTDSVGGTANPLRLNGVARRGGELVSIGTWTIDAGEGVDDHWVAVTSEGEVIVYKGADPSNANTWALVGVWHLGSPIGQRCLLKYAGDILVNCEDGVMPLSKALIADKIAATALTDKIQGAMSAAATTYGANFGWQMLHYPKATMLVVNVPTNSVGTAQQQYAMNTITGAWSRFTGIEANCWAIFNGEPYFGGAGIVGRFWNTYSDNGNNIFGEVLQAFSYFRQRGRLKHWKMARPVLATNGTPSLSVSLNVDYDTDSRPSTVSFTPSAVAQWDIAKWDQAKWGAGLRVLKNWQTMGALGVCAAMHFVSAQQLETRWMASDFIYEPGGFVG